MPCIAIANMDSLKVSLLESCIITTDSVIDNLSSQNIFEGKNEEISTLKQESIVAWRLQQLNAKTPIDLGHNEKVQVFIDNYLGRNKRLISRM